MGLLQVGLLYYVLLWGKGETEPPLPTAPGTLARGLPWGPVGPTPAWWNLPQVVFKRTLFRRLGLCPMKDCEGLG